MRILKPEECATIDYIPETDSIKINDFVFDRSVQWEDLHEQDAEFLGTIAKYFTRDINADRPSLPLGQDLLASYQAFQEAEKAKIIRNFEKYEVQVSVHGIKVDKEWTISDKPSEFVTEAIAFLQGLAYQEGHDSLYSSSISRLKHQPDYFEKNLYFPTKNKIQDGDRLTWFDTYGGCGAGGGFSLYRNDSCIAHENVWVS